MRYIQKWAKLKLTGGLSISQRQQASRQVSINDGVTVNNVHDDDDDDVGIVDVVIWGSCPEASKCISGISDGPNSAEVHEEVDDERKR